MTSLHCVLLVISSWCSEKNCMWQSMTGCTLWANVHLLPNTFDDCPADHKFNYFLWTADGLVECLCWCIVNSIRAKGVDKGASGGLKPPKYWKGAHSTGVWGSCHCTKSQFRLMVFFLSSQNSQKGLKCPFFWTFQCWEPFSFRGDPWPGALSLEPTGGSTPDPVLIMCPPHTGPSWASAPWNTITISPYALDQSNGVRLSYPNFNPLVHRPLMDGWLDVPLYQLRIICYMARKWNGFS